MARHFLIPRRIVFFSEVSFRSKSSPLSLPFSTPSQRSLRSSDRLDLFVLHVRTTMAQFSSLARTGPPPSNGLPHQSTPPVSLLHPTIASNPAFSPAAFRVQWGFINGQIQYRTILSRVHLIK